jgi:hypothetical protein
MGEEKRQFFRVVLAQGQKNRFVAHTYIEEKSHLLMGDNFFKLSSLRRFVPTTYVEEKSRLLLGGNELSQARIVVNRMLADLYPWTRTTLANISAEGSSHTQSVFSLLFFFLKSMSDYLFWRKIL